MTSEQLEKAARHYCALKHLDPDKIVSGAGPGLTSSRRPAWERVAAELEDMHAMFESIKEATGDTMTNEQLQQAID